MSGPQTPECDIVHATKYRGDHESHREACNRIAASLQDNHEHYSEFREMLMDMRFLPAGRIQAAMGSTKNITPYNCFVSGTIEDTFVDGDNSIMGCATQAATTMRQGGGIGYDFSTLRPRGDLIRGVQSQTDGPLAFAPIFDAVCRATSSAGNRRGAQMMVLRIDHPDVEAFIRAKQNEDQLTGFNMSLAVTDEFMECLEKGQAFPLRFGGKVYREVDPVALWEMVMRGTYDWAEPGVLFIDTINRMNNLYYCETIAATNPCGEQPLPPYGACLLGSINVPCYLRKDDCGYYVDKDLLRHDLPHVVRSLDNVVDRARYPLWRQKEEAQTKRRMGVGVTGMANALEAMGHPYGSESYLKAEDDILDMITNLSYQASAELAAEKGSFQMYDEDRYLSGQFVRTLNEETQLLIKKHGIRNSHLTSIAPTGTISFCADNVSSGIEPVFAHKAQRRVNMPDGARVVEVEDYGVKFLGVRGKVSDEVTPEEHVAVLTSVQKRVDSAVSKTCNLPHDISWDAFKNVYLHAWEGGAKGCTTYRSGGMREGVMKAVVEEDGKACTFDPTTGTRTCDE